MNAPLFIESGGAHICKHGEILCGDSLGVVPIEGGKLMVLSDGLGSGVKANILATLTTKIAMRLMERGLPLEEVVETLTDTLPECKVRKIAYSTFTLLKVMDDGSVYLAEFDNPPTFFLKRGYVSQLKYRDRTIGTRKIREARVHVEPGDWLVTVSDGEIHAGIGGLLNLGWDWEKIAKFLETQVYDEVSAQKVAQILVDQARQLYEGKPGDDTTVGVLKIRPKRFASFMIGPPVKREDDGPVVEHFLSIPGRKIVSGGTTAGILAKMLGKDVVVDLSTMTNKIPPTGKLEGIDLVTEGVHTVNHALEILENMKDLEELVGKRDGASKLAWEFLYADAVNISLGQAINPAHLNPNLPQEMGFKSRSVQAIANILREKGKEVTLEIH
ncbi:MAG: SpoIIE family protein phosphatase [Desulfomonile tiedjei]|uniref:SpoIIE family protein phosphatase n=1 Tax=Desulfomonile tiedjei TaxID=2358 RepID=A0A9D6V427_9BACT|nr:SpoIIE family protein phosphatase [Desulfomonile tiedjei]